jgi:hypothetical protein
MTILRLRPFVIQMFLYHADDNNDDDTDAVDNDTYMPMCFAK